MYSTEEKYVIQRNVNKSWMTTDCFPTKESAEIELQKKQSSEYRVRVCVLFYFQGNIVNVSYGRSHNEAMKNAMQRPPRRR